MAKFQVTFEDVGFTDDRKFGGVELNQAEVAGFNATSKSRFPSKVLELLSAHVAEDDAQGKKDIKVFVSIDLLIDSDSEDSAESFAPPVKLLESIAARLLQSARKSVDMQQNWETTMAVEPEVV